ncbi:MAG: MFS transporter [Puia sp.]|nr:MFS transporter [Puia sp.]
MSTSPQKTRQAIAVYFFLSGFGFSTWASRIPTIQQSLKLNEAQLGAVLFALPVGLLMTLPVTGALLGKHNSRRILFIGAILFNGMLSLIGFAAHTWQLVLALFCFGVSRNLMNISVNAQAIGVQGLYGRPIIAGFHGIWSMAGFGGAALGSLMVSLNILPGWHFLTVALLLTAVAVYFFPQTLHQEPVIGERKPLFSFPRGSLLRFGMISFASMACEGTMYDWSGIYFQKALHVSRQAATIGFVVYMVAMTLGRFTGDGLTAKFGIRRMLTCSGLLIASGLLLAVLLTEPLVAGFGFMLVGFGVSCVIPLVFSMAGKSKELGSGAAIASVSTVGYLGFLVVPPLVGSVAELAGLRWAFGMMAVLGASITLMIRVRSDRETYG